MVEVSILHPPQVKNNNLYIVQPSTSNISIFLSLCSCLYFFSFRLHRFFFFLSITSYFILCGVLSQSSPLYPLLSPSLPPSFLSLSLSLLFNSLYLFSPDNLRHAHRPHAPATIASASSFHLLVFSLPSSGAYITSAILHSRQSAPQNHLSTKAHSSNLFSPSNLWSLYYWSLSLRGHFFAHRLQHL